MLCFLIKFANSETLIDSELGNAQTVTESGEQNSRQLSLHKESLLNLLAQIEKRYGETAGLLNKLRKEIESKRVSVARIRDDINVLHHEIKMQNKELSGQIRSAYRMGQKDKLKLILNQQDPGLSSRMMIYYNYINKARIKKLAEINQSLVRLNQLEKNKQQESMLLEKDQEQKKSEQAILDQARQQRNEILAQINNAPVPDAEQLSYLIESENKLKSVIAVLQSSENSVGQGGTREESISGELEADAQHKDSTTISWDEKAGLIPQGVAFSSLKGKLPWPIKGQLVQKFGSPRSDSVWDGVLIDAKEGTDIHSVNAGKVVYAEWLRGYGLLIIIDHGQDYMTLYAFNQSLYKKIGETVNAGDIIASVGQSGGRTQSGLYFGIRKKGLPIDPLDWCKK